MRINSLSLENFRNFSSGVLYPDKEMNIFYGDNAEGKTNLMEAIWLFCGQKSFRNVKNKQLIKLGESSAKLELSFFSEQREQTAKILLSEKKDMFLNDIPLSSPSELAGVIPMIIFAPDHLDLVKDGPKIRRQFLDSTISQLRPKYQKCLSSYNRVILQRNNLLKDSIRHSEIGFMLDIFEERAASLGAYIISKRVEYLEAIKKEADEIYKGISGNKETFSLEYLCSSKDGGKENLIEAFKKSRTEDTKTATTGVGPHRDDIEFLINDLSVKTYGSQGQQRSSVLALKLAEVEILKRFSGEQPIVLLDDVMSELDAYRQDFILNHIKGWQVFITCCDLEIVKKLNSGRIFHIKRGQLDSPHGKEGW